MQEAPPQYYIFQGDVPVRASLTPWANNVPYRVPPEWYGQVAEGNQVLY